MLHSEWSEDFLLREYRERFTCKAFHDFTEQYESKVGIFNLLTRLMNKRFSEDSRENRIMSPGFFIEIAMRWKARIVEQKHARRDACAPRRVWIIFCCGAPFRQEPRKWSVKIDPFLLHENHHGGRCCDWFRK